MDKYTNNTFKASQRPLYPSSLFLHPITADPKQLLVTPEPFKSILSTYCFLDIRNQTVRSIIHLPDGFLLSQDVLINIPQNLSISTELLVEILSYTLLSV